MIPSPPFLSIPFHPMIFSALSIYPSQPLSTMLKGSTTSPRQTAKNTRSSSVSKSKTNPSQNSSNTSYTQSALGFITSLFTRVEDLPFFPSKKTMIIGSCGAVAGIFLWEKSKGFYRSLFVEPRLLSGVFRSTPLHITNCKRIIENCVLSDVTVTNATLIVRSGAFAFPRPLSPFTFLLFF